MSRNTIIFLFGILLIILGAIFTLYFRQTNKIALRINPFTVQLDEPSYDLIIDIRNRGLADAHNISIQYGEYLGRTDDPTYRIISVGDIDAGKNKTVFLNSFFDFSWNPVVGHSPLVVMAKEGTTEIYRVKAEGTHNIYVADITWELPTPFYVYILFAAGIVICIIGYFLPKDRS